VLSNRDSQPVREALRQAEKALLRQFIALLPEPEEWDGYFTLLFQRSQSKAEQFQQPVWAKVRAAYPTYRKLIEASRWASESRPKTKAERRRLAATLMQKMNREGRYEAQQVMMFAEILMRGMRGAPVKRRSAAVRALDLKLQKPKAGWREIAAKCCNCGQGTHTHTCEQVIRQEVIALKKVLRRLEINIPGI